MRLLNDFEEVESELLSDGQEKTLHNTGVVLLPESMNVLELSWLKKVSDFPSPTTIP